MKYPFKSILRGLLVPMILLVTVGKIFAQSALQDEIDEFINYYTELLTALTIVWGYVARFIPKLKDVPMKVINVIAFLIVAGGAFIWMDLTSPIQVVIAAFSAAGIYSYILKPGTKLFELVANYLPLLIDILLKKKRKKEDPIQISNDSVTNPEPSQEGDNADRYEEDEVVNEAKEELTNGNPDK